MSAPALTSEPYFWIKEVALPVGLTLVTSLVVFYAKRVLQIAKEGYRRSALKRAEADLKFALRLRQEPNTAQIWLLFQAASSAFPVAACAIGSAMLVIGYVGAKALPESIALSVGSIMIGVATAQLATHFFEAIFVLRATMIFDKLEQKLQDRIARFEK